MYVICIFTFVLINIYYIHLFINIKCMYSIGNLQLKKEEMEPEAIT